MDQTVECKNLFDAIWYFIRNLLYGIQLVHAAFWHFFSPSEAPLIFFELPVNIDESNPDEGLILRKVYYTGLPRKGI